MQELAKYSAARREQGLRWFGRSRRERRETFSFYMFILPWLLGFLGLAVIPLLLGFATSLTNYDGLNLPTVKFVGLSNYGRAFSKKDFWISLANSAKYAIFVVPVGMSLAFILAVMLNRPIRGRDWFRLLYYIPAVLPVTGAIRAWGLMFHKNAGFVNAFLSIFRPGTAINWVNTYFFLMLYLYTWWHAGGPMVIFLAGLQNIPVELYEAARLDGANRIQVFWRVTLPLMTPVLFFQLIMGLIGSLQIMDVPILLYGRAGLSGQIQLPISRYMYMVYIYSQTFDFQRFGYGVALSWIFFVIVLILTLIVIVTSRYWVYYEVEQEAEAA